MTTLDFLTKELFEKSLKGYWEDNNIKILGYSSKAAVGTGENYTSELFRVNVTYGRGDGDIKETISLIVKIQPVGTAMEILTTELKLFSKEMEMFGKTLPMMYDILGPEMKGSLSSICLLQTQNPTLLVLEDLAVSGFVMASRQAGLDLDHCKLVMKKIAMFHATSVVLAEKNPSSMTNYNFGIYNHDEKLGPWLTKGIESLVNTLLATPGLEIYGMKLQKLGKEIINKGIEAGDRRLGGFNVLNHGDLWINNMLFKYGKNGKLEDLKYVDFQLVKYTSPALDLHYFLSTSPTVEVRRNHVNTLLNVYYGNLIANLASLNYCLNTVPSREEFLKDFNSRGFYGILSIATVLPLVRASHRDDATYEDLMKEDGVGSFRHHCYTNENYVEFLEIIMPQLNSIGTFN